MLYILFAKIINAFIRQKKESIDSDSDIILIQKQQLFHKDIPDLDIVKQMTGNNFIKLQEIFNHFDPAKKEKLKDYPNKYEFLTKTVIYKLPTKSTRDAVADLLYLEFSLWFKHEYNNFSQKDELITEVYEFKNRYLIIDPFEQHRHKN